MTVSAIRGEIVSMRADPFLTPPEEAIQHLPDGLILIEDGKIAQVTPWSPEAAKGLPVTHYPTGIISAGFIDGHVHYPQTQMIGAFGLHLLDWLNEYTFIAEQAFADKTHAQKVAKIFLRELLRAGTTTAAVYCSVHPQSVDAFFEESSAFNTRMIAGKVLMDRNAPEALQDTAESGYAESKALIERWHGKGRQHYCVTPRFAPSCSPEQLSAAGRLWSENPGTYMQTHLCETTDEIEWVLSLFPERKSYLDVYAHYGLTGPRAIFGHGVHMTEEDFSQCHSSGSALCHCPTSNLFLGSGLFRAFDARKKERPVRTALGTDLGAGTSFSQLQTLNEAYKVAQLNGTKLTAAHGLWLATRGGAEALYLDDRIGSIEAGKDADLVVLDTESTPLLKFRDSYAKNLMEKLFVLMTLGDDRAVRATYVAGVPVYDRDRSESFTYPGAQ
ncbi:guanine deaminase [Pusillimonas sp. CC-YST705]|uniref:Guanine deaminase n=1 Tax=Mesopusillimonas faecipullorum TaxID=2755040 RepID=A0ABS8CFB5_9BURK|nr:guanine deaminase [Mesopusillimonas faecipullorum]MCB5364735.1 guanine deaminase [Mesopusillimonas faecipullorum]